MARFGIVKLKKVGIIGIILQSQKGLNDKKLRFTIKTN